LNYFKKLSPNFETPYGGASGRYDQLRDTAFEYAWIIKQVGVNK
jgi:oligopeptidase B